MGLSYHYTFGAPKSIPTLELESFVKTVERKAKGMGFAPTILINGSFATDEQRQFARRITTGLTVIDPRLKGVTLFDASRAWNLNPELGECRVIPEHGVLLVVTDERRRESLFGFLRYPDTLLDLAGKELAAVPTKGRWHFRDFVDSPDRRYRTIVRMFADAGYLESEKDEYAPQ